MFSSSGQKKRGLLYSWSAILLSIPLLSVFGRPLQQWVIPNLGYNLIAGLIFFALAAALAGLFQALYRSGDRSAFVHIAWVLPLFLVGPLLLGRVEERLHFLVFGLFGGASMFLYAPRAAFLLCLAVAAGDEVLQYYLPDRVGDWRDVAMNALASVAAALFVWLAFVSPRRNRPEH